MLWFWIIVAAVVYFVFMACVLLFFVAVAKVNRRWDEALDKPHSAYDEEWYRAA